MRTQEDKYMASQLNGLDTLPAGYEANMASKWEMVQMGMAPSKKRFPVYYKLAIAACLLLMIGTGYFIMSNNKQTAFTQTNEAKGKGLIVNPNNSIQKNAVLATDTKKVNVKHSNTIKQLKPSIIATTVDSAVLVQQTASTQPVQQATTTQGTIVDTASNKAIVSAAAQPLPKKNRPHFFQMDFGEGSPIDAQQKNASSKLFQFKLSHKVNDGSNYTSSKNPLPQIAQPL